MGNLANKLRPAKLYNRSLLIDALRGIGIVLMVIFHFFYDLTLFNLADIPMYTDIKWISFRYVILSCFLGATGASLYLHYQRGFKWNTYGRRLLIIAANAIAITIITSLVLSDKYIFFGILHLIATASVLGLLFVRFYWINLIIGALIVYIGFNYSNDLFNHPLLRWLGMVTRVTSSADFTPIFPWFGVVLLGMFTARLLGKYIYIQNGIRWLYPLAVSGRYSLIIYMLHQPILWGLIYLYLIL